jgi:hypothetical protein
MLDQLFGGLSNIAVTIFVLAVCLFLGVALLVSRIGEARTRRRVMPAAIGGRGAGAFDLVPANPAATPATAPAEIQLRDANQALFKVLMECCQMIEQASQSVPLAGSDAATYAANLVGRNAMNNREIADHGYQLATHLQAFDDATIVAIRRVLAQLALAEQWTTNWHGGG